MQTHTTVISVIAGSILGAVAIALLLVTVPHNNLTGSATDNVLSGPTSTLKFVLTTDTTVIATNTARQYLEIANISGATSTGQAIYCNTGDVVATAYKGFVIFASSTKVLNLDNLYRGAIHCISVGNAATVSVMEQ